MNPNKSNSHNSLNLMIGGKLSVSDSLLLDQLEAKVRFEYNHFTDEFIQRNNLEGLSLLLNLSCRNTLASPMLDMFCKIALLEEKIKKSQAPKIIYVDNNLIAEIVNQILVNYKQDIIVKVAKVNRTLYLHVMLNFIKSTYLIIAYWIWTRLMRLKKIPIGKVLFVDNFILIDSFKSNGFFVDRYYTGHEDYLSYEEKKVKWYSPTLVGINYPKQMLKIGKGINSSKENFLIQEAWLTISDYLYAIYSSLRIPFRVQEFPKFRGYNFNKILLREIYKDIASPSLMLAICKYRFIRRLSRENINICQVVDWNENQIIDRAINLGFKDYYKDIIVHGYQGFVLPEHYACVQPTCLEYDLKTLPDIMHVPGKAGNALRKSVCPRLPVKISPAFRFSHVFHIQDLSFNDGNVILVVLPMMKDESRNILNSIANLKEALDIKVKIIAKPHPSMPMEDFLSLAPELQREEITHKSMKELLELASVMISSTSSSCVEAVAVGVPVGIYGNRYGVTMNPIPSNVPNELWEVYYTKSQLVSFVSRALLQRNRNSIVNELFHPVDIEGTRELFALS